jgi:hypothetical protein
MLVQDRNLTKIEDYAAALVTAQLSDEGLTYNGT